MTQILSGNQANKLEISQDSTPIFKHCIMTFPYPMRIFHLNFNSGNLNRGIEQQTWNYYYFTSGSLHNNFNPSYLNGA